MYEKLNDKLIRTKGDLQMKDKLSKMLECLKLEIKNKKIDLELLEQSLMREEGDIRKLEGLSIASIFYSVLGNKTEHINKEKKEFLEAKLKYEDCKHQLLHLKEEEENVKGKIKAIGMPEYDYEILLKKIEEVIINIDMEKASKLSELSDTQADLNHNIKEVKEAINSGNNVLDALNGMISSLKSAEGWGTWDMLGGGAIATMVKHSKIDEAKDAASEVQSCLNSFNRELADVSQISSVNLGIDISSFETFADYFFDGLISDWMVQSKIKNSLSNTIEKKRSVENIIYKLQSELKELICKLEDSIRIRKEIIELFSRG
ncbi:hypothetical protein LGK97_06100 [Clostridium sp. CS001]|uniref:hypothetical protein n=1 Tax=Clostridium sp. CS001 TaxID=2880648 RepID=UPI001CF42E76|nr:hypothetical protein [Clostridium sp. CS001]MCB2289336.1 hypothetical protein [Clostridium sp. CS001]